VLKSASTGIDLEGEKKEKREKRKERKNERERESTIKSIDAVINIIIQPDI